MTERANVELVDLYDEDPNRDYDREREDALREQMYIEAERAELELLELGIEVPYTGPRLVDVDELEDIPF